MPEFGGIVSLEISKLSQKPRNLSNDSKEIIRSGMVVHFKSFNSFIVLDDRIERSFFEFLPIPTKIILSIGIK